MYWWICSPILWVVILFFDDFLCCAKLFSLMKSHLFIFSFVSLAWGDISYKILLWAMSKILSPLFSSRIFMVLRLTFKSLIHFELILVCDVRRWSSFIFLHIFDEHIFPLFFGPLMVSEQTILIVLWLLPFTEGVKLPLPESFLSLKAMCGYISWWL